MKGASGGLAGHIAGILFVGLLVGHAAGLMIVLHDRELASTRTFALAVADHLAVIVEHLEAVPAARRPAFLDAHQSRWLLLELSDSRPPLAGSEWRHADQVRPAVLERLAHLGERTVEVRVPDPWRPRWHGGHGEQAPPRPRQGQLLAVSVGLADGGWLLATVASEPALPRGGRGTLHWMLMTLTSLTLLGLLAARRLTRPLRRFAAAADRLGVDVHAPPLPESGSRELRRAVRAFNRMQQRLRRLVDDRTRTLAAISHDLRTALTRLKLRAEYIGDDEQRDKAQADLDEMAAMLGATLAFARDEALDEERTRVDLAALLASLCDDLADAGQPVSWAGPPRCVFAGRPRALRRAFANLIDNAVRYGGGAEVTLSEGADRVEVTVADRGPGIPEEERERVFAPFYRLEPSRSRETGGSGLGLALARSAAHHHGGGIVLEERPGGGLLVRVELPVAGS